MQEQLIIELVHRISFPLMSLVQEKVEIIKGSCSFVIGNGSIKISKHLILNPALHVPALACYFLPISKLIKELNGVAKFFSHPL